MLKAVRLVVAAIGAAGMFSGIAAAADAPAVTYLPASAAATFENAPAIVEGASGKNVKSTIYVFMDPNCIFCHYAWKALQPYEAAGLQVHWIPMGFLKPDSPGKAAALLEAQNAPALMRELETKFSEKDESGGIKPLDKVSFATQTKLNGNAKMFKDFGFDGTPTIIYQTSGGRWADVSGLPHLSALPALLNLPEQAITDPSLQRFR
ncbi:thioredoxin fold domain-containing protein [Paraburkholderia sp. D15]|uniref:thioredoxin fold domain-containing protein n=1 Tax=Paraburkholderia sp. D15 TaxID=2880218 RepID=UPI00247A17DE|nr:thioredoxin fold domain-containing protein [Paraburkholderia sp. D15]WGS48747.1 thioredoxin fold domain-containing protein [Paraburkholderia sp. D15]